MSKKILIVDDEKDLIELMEGRLALEGYDLITASDGVEALNKAKVEKPDLMILDLMLPKIDGFQVCKMLKSDSDFCKIPIIILSARVSETDRSTGMKAGADAYITKPIDSKLLLEKVKELINK